MSFRKLPRIHLGRRVVEFTFSINPKNGKASADGTVMYSISQWITCGFRRGALKERSLAVLAPVILDAAFPGMNT